MNLHRKHKLAQGINSFSLERTLLAIPVQGYLAQRCYVVSMVHFPELPSWFSWTGFNSALGKIKMQRDFCLQAVMLYAGSRLQAGY